MGKILGIIIVIFVLAAALGGGIWLNQFSEDDDKAIMQKSEDGDASPTGGDGALQPVQATLEEMLPDVSNTGGDNTAVESREPTPDNPVGEFAELKAVGEFTGFGVGTRVYDGENFVHDVQAQLPAPAPGTFYEGWLVRKKPTTQFFSTGKLEPSANGYDLVYIAQQDYPEHRDVVITQETSANGLDGTPEDHVLEGTFEEIEFGSQP